MGLIEELGHVERLQFFEGQRLTKDDLQALEAYHREMRQLHNRSLHQPGVGSGFSVTGQRGDREVKIRPGYAIDAEGREIILTRERTEQIPPVAGDENGKPVCFDLTISYPDDQFLEEIETREGVCQSRGAVRLIEEPVFCWIELEENDRGTLHPKNTKTKDLIQAAYYIVLARIYIQNCQIETLSTKERVNARCLTQPYIACGKVKLDRLTPDLQIDTSDAGFRLTPCYFVELIAPEIYKSSRSEIRVSVEAPAPDNFTLCLVSVDLTIKRIEESKEPWIVMWMGIE